jgi:mercuric ion binding protein
MKTIFSMLIVAAVVAISNPLFAQSKKPVTTVFWVGGVCEMCKERIERAVDIPGVKAASYNLEKHELTVTYSPKKINEEKLHELLNKSGHDTSKSQASDEAYSNVHGCCKYREHEHNH